MVYVKISKSKIFKIVAIIVVLFVASNVNSRTTYAFSGGSGTSGSPYQITTAAELASLSSYLGAGNSGKYFKVMNDIDLNVSPYNTGTGWTPIGTSSNGFYGKLDGNFKSISNLYYNSSGSNYAGLFGNIGSSGIIQNTILNDATVTGNLEVGALTGANSGTITKSGVSGGSVTGIQRVGGLVGSNYGSMTYDYSNNSVYFNPTSSPTCCSGGLIGEAYSGGTINNSYSRSSVTMTYNIYNQGAVGGLYGNDYSSGAKSNLYSTGAITMVSGSFPSSTGGLAGSNYTSTTSSYWDTQTSGWATSSGGAGVVGKTTAQMKTQSTYSGWDFSTIWAIDGSSVINDGYPYLQWQVTDTTAPTITNVSSDKTNGSYKTGEVIDIDVTFSEAVTSTGNVTITLETGDTDRTCTFSITSTTTGTCNYTVQAGDLSSDLTVISISGTITDGSANSMSNFTPTTNLAANKAIVIDTTSPTVAEVTAVSTPTSDTTPNYVFSSNEVGTITYDGDCTSATNSATASSNTITFSTLSAATHNNCTIIVSDAAGNASNTLAITSFTIDTSAPTTPGDPLTTSPTNDSTPTWSWTASTDSGGSGLATIPYTLQWSQSSSFSSSVFAATSSSASYIHTTALADGVWYFRVLATDIVSNNSSYSQSGSVLIDSTAPSTPGSPISISNSTDNTPIWAWAESSDITSGLSTSPYTIEWSKDSNFVNGIFSTTSSGTTFAHTSSLSNGTWYFRVKATDLLGNTSLYSSIASTNINILVPIATVLTSSFNDATAAASPNILLDEFQDYTSGNGKPLSMERGQVVYFKVNTDTHSASVTEIGSDYAVIVLHSDPITARLNVGQTRQYDVNKDGTNDISITLNSISGDVAQLIFAQVKQNNSLGTNKSPAQISTTPRNWRPIVILGSAILVIMSISKIKAHVSRDN